MGSTYVSLHYHITFTTKDRRQLMAPEWRNDLHGYLAGVIGGRLNGTARMIGGVSDHVHLLVSLDANHRLKDFMRDLKKTSSQWAARTYCPEFRWQDGYAAFTVSASLCDKVLRYIESQEEHHRTITFIEELRILLKKHGVKYDPQYLE